MTSAPKTKPQQQGRATAGRASLLACLAAGAVAATPAGAEAAGPSFSVQPVGISGAKSYFVLDAAPGRVLTDSVRVANTGDASGTVKLYAVDATTGQTSGAVYRSAGSPRRDVGAWTRLGVKKLTLGPGEVRDVAVKVRVPKSASAGEHLGGIVAENTKLKRGPTKSRGRGRFRINVRNLAVTAVQVNLPGPRVRKLSLGSVKSGGSQGGNQTVLVGIANEGNVLLKPSLSIAVADGDGNTVQRRKLKLDTFVPGTSIDLPVPVKGNALRSGSYTATVEVAGGGSPVRATRSFEVTSKQVKQVFGADSPLAQESSRSFIDYLPWILLALIAGGAAAYVAMRRLGGGADSNGGARASLPPDPSPSDPSSEVAGHTTARAEREQVGVGKDESSRRR